jgi:hypothetical protein
MVLNWAPSLKVGHANFTMVEEIPPGEEVLDGTIYLFEHHIIILFDSRASHDFMSLACAQKAKLNHWATKVPYYISTPGGRVVANWMVRKTHSILSGECFLPILSFWKIKGYMLFWVRTEWRCTKFCWTSLLVWIILILLSSPRLPCSYHLLPVSRHLFTPLLWRFWMKYMWFMNI